MGTQLYGVGRELSTHWSPFSDSERHGVTGVDTPSLLGLRKDLPTTHTVPSTDSPVANRASLRGRFVHSRDRNDQQSDWSGTDT